MPFVDYKEPILSKINWAAGIQVTLNALAYLLAQDWVKSNVDLVLLLNSISGILIFLVRTFLPTVSTTWAIKGAILLALTFGLSGGQAYAGPIRKDCANCRAMSPPTAKLSAEHERWFRAMPLPWIERQFIRIVFQ